MSRRRALWCKFSWMIVALLLSRAAHGQTTEPSPEHLRILVMTIGPGDDPWEQFGHNAICLYDPASGNGIAYSYGEFSFDQPNFIGRFILGRMRYWMAGYDLQKWVDVYGPGADRDIWVQELNLSAQQVQTLAEFLENNTKEENKYYRYDYYRDNCTTRVRDAIDLSLKGRLREQLQKISTDRTYRWYTRKDLAGFPSLLTGIELTAGQPVDRKLSAWEESFIPLVLRDRLNQTLIADAAGRSVPLVVMEKQIYKSKRRPPPRDAPPNWVPWFLISGIAIGGALLLTSHRRWRRTFLTLAIVWSILAGGAGIFIISLRLFTDHEAGYRNENLFQFEPLSLALIVLMPKMLRGKRVGRYAIPVALAALSISVLGIVVKLLPWFFQNNWWMISLALPIHAALLLGLLHWTRMTHAHIPFDPKRAS